eukprot:CAMPEP_0116898356 /NCGR_PEP_ID=MMETSP0467-20121206/7084_1 /TAXON_ID=283647 /ORGANISM="Mesodinium pulex, Strain SPMC105" /LENGTH=37 /DNA_ID= /DNA_START= /DNA_END= /DNA_ORIENTATION=
MSSKHRDNLIVKSLINKLDHKMISLNIDSVGMVNQSL